MNSICVTGRLTADPHHQPANLDDGVSARTTFRLAIQGPRGEREEGHTTYITVISHGPTAIAVADHLVKGALVGVHGRLDYREWDDPKGQHHSIHRIISHRVEFLERRGNATDHAAA